MYPRRFLPQRFLAESHLIVLLKLHVFDVRGDEPAVAPGIANESDTIAIGLVHGSFDGRGARADGLRVQGVGVRNIEMQVALRLAIRAEGLINFEFAVADAKG